MVQLQLKPPVVPQLVAALPELVMPQCLTLGAGPCLIGRRSSCDLVADHPLVSRLHARVEPDGARYLLVDLGSANGTYVNGVRLLEQHPLSNQDQIGLGRPTPLLAFVDPDSTQIASDLLSYNERTMRFLIGGTNIELSPMQFRLLRQLYQCAGTVCTRERCAEALWGRDYEPELDTSALDQALNSLRRTLRSYGLDRELIETRRGQGYVLRL